MKGARATGEVRAVLSCDPMLLSNTHAGGYHPVFIGEKYKSGQTTYIVLKKLGWGHFSTVWLVQDETTGKYGAMKVRMGM